MEPALVARTESQRFHFPSATRNPTKGMTASLGTGAIMLSRAMRKLAPRYPVASRQCTAQLDMVSVSISGFLYGSSAAQFVQHRTGGRLVCLKQGGGQNDGQRSQQDPQRSEGEYASQQGEEDQHRVKLASSFH